MSKDELKNIHKLSKKAIKLFLDYENVCQEIERILDKEVTEEHLEVLYQPADGLVVSVDRNGYVDDNIPIEEYLKELAE